MTHARTLAGIRLTGRPDLGPDAYDSVPQMTQRVSHVLHEMIRRGYVRTAAGATEMQGALDEGTPYALIHLCDVLLGELADVTRGLP